MAQRVNNPSIAFSNQINGYFGVKQIGNSDGIIIPKNFAALKKGDKIPFTYKNGQLTLNIKHGLMARRSQLINDSFEGPTYSTKDVGKMLKKNFGTDYGWK